MNILLDENLSRKLARHFPDAHLVSAIEQLGWKARRNGELLQLASRESYDLLITLDDKMRSQQSVRTVPFPVIVLHPSVQGLSSASSLIVSRVVPLLQLSLRVGFYDVWHDGRITFRLPSDDHVEEITLPEDGDNRG